MKYRKEIDGLRTLAVLPVMLFHAGFQTFSGGFVGVDVFFVISGYLITTILITEIENNNFSIINFYERRARRILPALFFMMLVCLQFSILWFMPQDFQDFSQSLIAVSLFSSNFLFWQTSGYFELSAELKPLLHTWSLAIEEQYYLIFPLFLMLTWKISKRFTIHILIIVFIASLAIAQWGSIAKPAATFYLLPTRGWELLLGSFIAFYIYKNPHSLQRNSSVRWEKEISEFGGILGIGMVLYAIFSFNKNTPFPSLYTLLPTIGASLIIIYANQANLAGRFIGNKFFVFIGLISYSAYLWHQPLFAFIKYKTGEEISKFEAISIIILSIIIAFFSWRYIERPFRDKNKFTRNQIFALWVGGSFLFCTIGLFGIINNGFPNRFLIRDQSMIELIKINDLYGYYKYAEVVRYGKCHSVPFSSLEANGCFDIREKNIMLWGDSYAASLYSGFNFIRNKYYQNYGIIQVTDGNSPPFFIEGITDDGKSVIESNNNRIKIAEKLQPQIVVISWMIDGSNKLDTPELAFNELNITIKKILQISKNSKIIIIGPFPKWAGTLQKQLVEYNLKTGKIPPKFMTYGLIQSSREWDNFFKEKFMEFSKINNNITYISSQDYLCNKKGCLTIIGDSMTDISAVDWGHLTINGSIYLGKKIGNLIFN